jgi:adenine-specific DNA methylase
MSDESVDLICMDPPYYNNVQYAELSDFFYVWMKRTLKDLYPSIFIRRLTNKIDEAVANPDRDGSSKKAKNTYETMMGEIFSECRRLVRNNGMMTLMFTHKKQDAWEALTRSIIEKGWIITSCVPVSSESSQSMNIKGMAAAVSSIFITCRKRLSEFEEPASWIGFGGTGVAQRIRQAVAEGLKEFAVLKLNPVDEMVASYGRALGVLSEQWPVIDGDEVVGPIKAMSEASRVVAEHQIKRITGGRLQVEDLVPEAAMALTLFGIYGLSEFPYDEALNLSRSLNIRLEGKSGGYIADGRFIGINTAARGRHRAQSSQADETGFHAPLVRTGSKLRLAKPGERDPRRLDNPQTDWDILHGMIMAFRQGDIPVARGYLDRQDASRRGVVLDLLGVWAAEAPDEALRKEAQAMLFGLK